MRQFGKTSEAILRYTDPTASIVKAYVEPFSMQIRAADLRETLSMHTRAAINSDILQINWTETQDVG